MRDGISNPSNLRQRNMKQQGAENELRTDLRDGVYQDDLLHCDASQFECLIAARRPRAGRQVEQSCTHLCDGP